MSEHAADAFDDGLGDFDAADGPWSLADAPDDQGFISFGVLRLPAFPGMNARAEFDAKTRRLGAVSVRIAGGDAQFQVLAAPRGQGIWTDVRRSLVRNLKAKPGHQQAYEGRFGPELIATVTGRDRAGNLSDVPLRYVGVDGDRWLLRVVVTGPTVLSDATIARVDDFISRVAVERGAEAVPAGHVLELSPPPGAHAPDEPTVPAGEADSLP